MENLDPITRQYLGVINSYKDRSGMSATELVQITWLFKIEFTEYFLVGLGDLPESTRPQRKEKR